MAESILVAYATRTGSTREVAEAIAARLREHSLEVDIQPMKTVASIAGFQAVVLGAPLIMGRWHKDARRFLSQQRAAMENLPAAVFALGPVHDVEEEWQGARNQLDKALANFPWFKPLSVEVFGGKFDLSLMGFPWNLLPGLKKVPSSDIRDWKEIRAWADNLAEKVQHESPAPWSRPAAPA